MRATVTKNMRKTSAYLLVLFLVSLYPLTGISAQNLVPNPRSAELGNGSYRIDSSTALIFDGSLRHEAVYLLDYIPFAKFSDDGSGAGKVSLEVDGNLGEEAYELTCDPSGVKIVGGDASGVFYGIQTLLQLCPPRIYSRSEHLPLEIPHCSVKDAPRFHYRGFSLDVARTWIPASQVKRCIDFLSYHKFNRLHFHLVDDEGWRAEIKSHPEFAGVGGFRGGDSPVHPRYAKFHEKWGGYYTQAELKDIVAYAAKRHIEIIPEFDMPGHSKALGAIRHDILCDVTPDTARTNGLDIRNVWCASKESNYRLVEDIVREMSAIFPSQYFHVGGDEVNFECWKACPACQKLKREKRLKDERQIEDYFISRVAKILAEYGKRPAVWNEAIDGGLLDRSTLVYGWKNIKACRQAASKGYPTVLLPGSHFYLDMKQSAEEFGHNWAAIIDARRILSFPVDDFTQDEMKNILGIEASFFSEIYVEHEPEKPDYLDYMLFPRLCSVAEMGWCDSSVRRSWDPFYASLKGSHYDRMNAMGIVYRLFPPKVVYENGKLAAGTDDGAELYFRKNGEEWRKYLGPFRTSAPYEYEFQSRYGTGHSFPVCSREGYTLKKPETKITTSMPVSEKAPLEPVERYETRISRTTRAAKKGDWIQYSFSSPVFCRRIELQTGHVHLRRCLFLTGHAEVSYDGTSFVSVGELFNGGITFTPASAVRAVRVVCDSRSDAEDNVVIIPIKIY